MGRSISLVLATICIIAAVFLLLKPIPQPLGYHDFADKRVYWSISNGLNVLSNIFFIFTGVYGFITVWRSRAFPVLKWIYYWLFAGVVWTAFGSAYYHYTPGNDTLVWDRIPMTVVFMSLLAATIAEFINVRAGALLFPLLVITGIASVWYWHCTEAFGHGDLRLYLVVQFYPLVFIPVILVLYPVGNYGRGVRQLCWVVAWYVAAKLFEQFDEAVFHALQVVSGHTLKHIAAAISTWYLVRLFQVKHAH